MNVLEEHMGGRDGLEVQYGLEGWIGGMDQRIDRMDGLEEHVGKRDGLEG
jgi:hypothetical protein